MSDQTTIDYYNKNIESYIKRTFSADMTEHQERFLKYLHPKAKILDAGCGPGRDLLAFNKKGYPVLGFDAAEEMVRYVQEELKLPAIKGSFQEMEFSDEFDGIWASASLVHVPLDSFSNVLKRLWKALKKNGILSCSFKEGKGIVREQDRTFTYMNMDTLTPYLEDFIILDQRTHLSRDGINSTPYRWLNIIAKKKN